MVNLNKKFFTTGDIAKIFRVSRISAYKWVVSGKIKSFKIPGGRYQVTKKDLLDFIKKSGIDNKSAINLMTEDCRILIVDDEKLIIQALKEYLIKTHPSWHICSATDGFEAGRMLIKVNPNIILLDLFLPGINGFNLCRNVKNDSVTKDIKIIAITGYPTEENIEKITAAGADAVIAKPINMDELDTTIKKLLP